MTTEIKVLSSFDAFADNEILTLDRSAFPSDLRLGAIEWTRRDARLPDSITAVLHFVLARILERLDGYDFWLLTGDSVWQPDTKMVRYRKLFDALKVRGMDFEVVPERYESMLERDGKLKFFGAVKLAPSVAHLVPLTMRPGACSYIVARHRDSEWQFPLSSGWTGNWNGDSDIVAAISRDGGVVLQRVGYFDDPDTGLAAVMDPSVLTRIIS